MALTVSNPTRRALQNASIEPTIAVKIDGIEDVFSSGSIKEYIRIGDEGLVIDGSWYIGGYRELKNNKPYIDSKTTTYTIRQQMNYDEGEGSSVSTMTIGLVDKDEYITRLISPGIIIDDILGRKVQVFLGFGETSLADDYIEIFKGFVTKVNSLSGQIALTINHPDNKKKVSLVKEFAGELAVNLQPTVLTASLSTTEGLLRQVPGVLGTYLRIDDEIIKYSVISPTGVNLERAQLGTTAAVHNVGEQVQSFYTLEGNPLDLALYLMMSGNVGAPSYEDIPVESFVKYGPEEMQNSNALYFKNINLPRDFGIRPLDRISVFDAVNGSNLFTDRLVTAVESVQGGHVVLVDGEPLVYEANSPAVMSFKTQYDVLPFGMKMKPDEVDIDQHLFIRDFFHPSTKMLFYLTEDIDNGKEFLDDEIYKPIACYALPRKAKSSVGYSIGPIPGQDIKTLSVENTKNPRQASVERTTARAFFNEVLYKYDNYALKDDKFLRGYLVDIQESKARIPGGSRLYKVESKGLRSSLNGQNIVEAEAQRIANRYKYAAEIIPVESLFRQGIDIEIGDVVVLEGAGLKLSDIYSGSRNFKPRLFEVRNKELNIKTGSIDFELLDTGTNINSRYGLMSPVSLIAGVVNPSQFVITYMPGYPSKYGADEWQNWQGMFDLRDKLPAKIRTFDYTLSANVLITNISNNTFTLDQVPSLPIQAGMVLEIADYNESSSKQKLLYAFYQDAAMFDDGGYQYSLI